VTLPLARRMMRMACQALFLGQEKPSEYNEKVEGFYHNRPAQLSRRRAQQCLAGLGDGSGEAGLVSTQQKILEALDMFPWQKDLIDGLIGVREKLIKAQAIRQRHSGIYSNIYRVVANLLISRDEKIDRVARQLEQKQYSELEFMYALQSIWAAASFRLLSHTIAFQRIRSDIHSLLAKLPPKKVYYSLRRLWHGESIHDRVIVKDILRDIPPEHGEFFALIESYDPRFFKAVENQQKD